tara:strand:- start:242 stop:1774 length:1533 start_codon:yes stop_codon:yes gene_type:complete
MTTLRLILGDQLTESISSLRDINDQDVVLMCEVKEEATYVKHHKKKMIFIFSAMRHFAEVLKRKVIKVYYTKLDDPHNTGNFTDEVARHLIKLKCDALIVTEPGEMRVKIAMQTWSEKFGLKVDIRPDDRFLCSHQMFIDWAKGKKQFRMEFFYREMRRKYHILMDDNGPVGGRWNYDSDNRNSPKAGLRIPEPYQVKPDAITQDVIELVEYHFPEHFGDHEAFHYGVTRPQALNALTDFIENRLLNFGDYQDAMLTEEPWMYHAHISMYLNVGLLTPNECIKAAQKAYYKNDAPLNAVEGFIRQILGWREFIRGIYWLTMPGYKTQNYLSAKRKLPELYWTGKTKMNCLSQCVKSTKQHAYAHHIQRLMVLGNFALIAGIAPKYVNEWFLIVYIDAFEWVELPNVSGMILFADGGLLGSKPYAASGSYINKMSDYCKGCDYIVSKKNGKDACPFNYLYWDFLARNHDKLSNNPRVAMMYRTYSRMSPEKQAAIESDAKHFFELLYKNQA